jgi:hypothetical protein
VSRIARLVRRNKKETPVSSNLSDLIRKYLRIEGDKIKEVEVYFGSLPEAVVGK